MRINVNLATRYYYDIKKINLVLAVAGALLLLLMVICVGVAVANRGEINRLNKEQAALDAKQKKLGRAVSDKDYKAVLARIGEANSLIGKKTVNWLELLNRLEGVVPDGIAITGIEPSQKDNLLKIEGAARNFAALRIFLENLERSPDFPDVLLLSQKELKLLDKQQGLDFKITARLVL